MGRVWSVQLRDWRFQGCFFGLGVVSPFFPVLNTLLGVKVPKNAEPESEVPFAEDPALVFSFEDLAPAFQEPALQSPLLWKETALEVLAW